MMLSDRQKYEDKIGKWLASLRDEKNISQEFLAVQINKGQSDIAKTESGNKKATVLDILSWMVALDIPYDRVHEMLQPIYNEIYTKANSWKG